MENKKNKTFHFFLFTFHKKNIICVCLTIRTLFIRKLFLNLLEINGTNMLPLPLQALRADEMSDAARKSVKAIFRKARRFSEALSIYYMARAWIVLISICHKPTVPQCHLHLNPLHHLTYNRT